MKKTKLFGCAFLATMMCSSFSACSNDAEEVLAQESEIRLTSEIISSRVTDPTLQSTQIVEGQQVGVTIKDAKSEHNNIAWEVGENGELTNTQEAIYWDDKEATIIAYHPYNGAWTSNSEYFFSVNIDQSSNNAYLNSDLLWVKTKGTKTDKAIALSFNHKLSKINIKLTSDEVSDLSNAIISICNVKTKTLFNPITGELGTSSEKMEIKAGTTTENENTVSAIIIPQTISENVQFIKVTLGNKIYFYTLPNEKIFEAGKSYSYELTLKNQELKISAVVNISKWVDESFVGDALESVTEVDYAKTITIEEPGLLPSKIDKNEKYAITSLKIIGDINGTDIKFINEMMNSTYDEVNPNAGNLKKLDLSSANIVAGGEAYYSVSSREQYYTENNTVGDYMFYGKRWLKELILPDNIEKIGDNSFSACYKLENFIIPKNVTLIGKNAFGNCGISSIVIPQNVETIEMDAFHGTSIKSFEIQGNLKSLKRVFNSCHQLTSVIIPEGVEDITDAFWGCRGLKSVVIPKTVKEMEGAFSGCINLSSVSIAEDIEATSMDDTFKACSFTSISIPSGIESIDNAFMQNIALESITIPGSVNSMFSAFEDCSNLGTVIISEGVTEISSKAFKHTRVYEVTLPNSLKIIGDEAFSNASLSSIIIPTSVSTIGWNAFEYNSLWNFELPEGLTTISPNILYRASTSQIILPSTLKTIACGSFFGTHVLNKIIIKASTPPTVIDEYGKTIDGFNMIYEPANSNCDLYVPAESMDQYVADKFWGQFKSIKAIE